MKRLLRIGLNTLLQSLIPIVCWFLLGLTLDSNLVNVFSITYPIQFIANIIKEIFGTGANIKQEKENNNNAVHSGMVLGIVVGAIVFSLLCAFSDNYLAFMSMDCSIYKTFVIYSFLEMYISLVFQLVIQKLYFEDKDKIATTHTILFNIVNLVFLIGCSLITKNQILVIVITLSALALYTIGMLAWQFKKFKLDFNILTNIKYESNELVSEVCMFIIYFFGLSRIFSTGKQYMIAINFVSLITDTQWDMYTAMTTVAQIDIVHEKFNLKEHLKNAIIFSSLLISSVIILFFGLYRVYNVTFSIGLYFLLFQIVDLVIGIPTYIFSPFIQLKHSALKNTVNETSCYFIRTFLSVSLPTVFCCDIGQLSTSILSIIFYIIIFAKYFKITKSGEIIEKVKKKKFKENTEN